MDGSSDRLAHREARLAQWQAARLAALTVVVGRLGHDVRGALQSGLLMAERLRTSADPIAQRVCDSVGRSVDRASDMLRQAVDYAREGPVTLPRETVAVRELLAMARDQARGLGLLRVEAAVPEQLAANVDPQSAAQVLSELLDNAADAGARTVVIAAERAGRSVAFEIEDDGPGLPPTVADHPFRPGASESGGLGLAIAHDLAVSMGGGLAVVRTSPEGTRFRLTLPAAPDTPK